MVNCYLLGCEKTSESIIIDPGGDVDKLLRTLSFRKLKLKYILNTHGHIDHVGGNKRMKEATGVPILIHSADAPMITKASKQAALFGLELEDSPPADDFLEEGDVVKFGEISLQVIHTPGHSPGSICLFAADKIFVGDTLFYESIGRTDFPGGSYETLIHMVKTKIFPLGDHVRVFPGHGPVTTVGHERKYNPFF